MQRLRLDRCRSTSYRVVTAAVGALLVACALAIVLVVAVLDWTAMIAAAVIAALGVEALAAAARGRSALLARLGPLP